jgi:hypothetical protein
MSDKKKPILKGHAKKRPHDKKKNSSDRYITVITDE